MVPVVIDRYYRTLMKKLSCSHVFAGGIAICVLLYFFLASGDYEINNIPKVQKNKELTFMLHGDHVDSGYLKHVIRVLDRLGYKRVHNSSSFDLLWSHVYPFGDRLPFPKPFMQRLPPYQKVKRC